MTALPVSAFIRHPGVSIPVPLRPPLIIYHDSRHSDPLSDSNSVL